MSTDTAWSAVDVEFWAEIDGTEVECVAAIFTYAMNTIPKARFIAAVGRDVHSNAASTAHKMADTNIGERVKLYAKCSNKAGQASAAMPVGQKLVFDGYVTGVGMSRGIDSYRIAFDAIHWLVDLTYGTVLSSVSHPRNPADLAFQATWNTGSTTAGGEQNSTWAYNNRAMDTVNVGNVQKDLWGLAIKPWLETLAAEDLWSLNPAGQSINLQNAGNATSRVKIQKALDRIDADPPLEVTDADDNIAKKIAEEITCASSDLKPYTLHSLAATDFWSLIMHLKKSYMFTIIPFPDKAKVVPFIEGYRTHFQGDHALNSFSVAARDLQNIDVTNRLPRRLGGYAIYGSALDTTHAGPLSATQDATVIGSFVPNREPGMIMFEETPRWLNGTMRASAYGSSMGLSGGVTSNAVAHPGDTGSTELSTTGEEAEAAAKDNADTVQTIIDKYAHALYCCESLRQRSGKIVGPFRLDICPGSTIKFEGVSEKYTPGTQPIGHERFGHVVAVTCVLDGHSGKVQTVYDVSHLRTKKENADNSTSITGHPLYATAWPGDALI